MQPPETVAYGDHPSQVCDVYRGGDSVAVLIHGGFWRSRYGRDLEEPLVRDLVERGWTVWNIEYRRLGDGGGWPATFEDVAAAMDAIGAGVTYVNVHSTLYPPGEIRAQLEEDDDGGDD